MRTLLIAVAFLTGCLAAQKAGYGTLDAITVASNGGVESLKQYDIAKRAEYVEKYKAVKTMPEKQKLDEEVKTYSEQRDKALFSFKRINELISAGKNGGKAWLQKNLGSALAAYNDFSAFLKAFNIKLAEVK